MQNHLDAHHRVAAGKHLGWLRWYERCARNPTVNMAVVVVTDTVFYSATPSYLLPQLLMKLRKQVAGSHSLNEISIRHFFDNT